MIVRPIVCKRFIGRVEELAYLDERRREAGRSHGGLVFVKGEAGVGKSRLLAEVSASLLRTRWRVGVGRCLEFAQRPYGPILELLARFDRSSAPLAPAATKREQFDEILARFAAAAARTAIVAIVEDLHWADAATIEFLAYLATKIDTMRALVIVTLRPEDVHDEHPLYGQLARLLRTPTASSITLAPLSEAQMRSFVEDAAGDADIPAELRKRAIRTGDGNPFFTEELLKSAAEATTSRALPTTLRAAIMERLRPLDAAQRRVLTQAAVIGRRFDLDTLARTLPSPEAIEGALQRARGLQLIEEDGAGAFRFRHALTREAIYDELLAVQAQPMHRTIAELLERAQPGAAALESLAYHWWAAGDAERAARYNELAGDAAARVNAHADALAFYTRSAEALDAGSPARGALFEKIAQRHIVLGSPDAAYGAFERAAAVFARAGEHEREAACRVQQAITAYTLGRAHPTQPLETMLERLPPEEYRTRARVHLGIAWLTASFYFPDVAERHVQQVDARALDEAPDVRLRAHNIRAWTAMTVGDVARFRNELDRWLASAATVEQPGALAGARCNAAFCYAVLGLHDDARTIGEAGLALARTEQNPYVERMAHARLALAALLRGDVRDARDAVERLSGVVPEDQISLAHMAAWGSLTAAYLDDAELIARWFDDVQDGVTPLVITLCGAGFAEILARRGRLADARALLARRLRGFGELARGMMLTFLAVGKYGADDDVPSARAQLAAVAALPNDSPERCALPLFDAYIAHRHGELAAARRLARTAAEGLQRGGFRLLEAAALELAGDRDAAAALYERCGALYDARRLRPAPAAAVPERRASEPALSERERAITALVAEGRSNVEIARALSISHKTVEKHLGSAYRKLGFSSRAQLAAYVSRQ